MYEYLEHHGIKGQRWGVRNYQDMMGRLTAAGRERYGVGLKAIKKAKEKAGLKAYEAKVFYGRPALRSAKSAMRDVGYKANRISNKARRLSSKYRTEVESISKTSQMLYRSKKQLTSAKIRRRAEYAAKASKNIEDTKRKMQRAREWLRELDSVKETAANMAYSGSDLRYRMRTRYSSADMGRDFCTELSQYVKDRISFESSSALPPVSRIDMRSLKDYMRR